MTSGEELVEKEEMALEEVEALELASRRRRRFFLFCGLLVCVLLGGNILYGMVLTTRHDRSTCLACHRSSGPVSLWEPSERHSGGLTCAQCHGGLQGQKVRWCGFSARAETINPNCIGCHTSVVQGRPLGKVVEVRLPAYPDLGSAPKTYRWRLQELMYGWHLKKKVCLCTDCHRNISHDRESKVFEHRPKMAYCKACHYHAVKDDYVKVWPLSPLRVREGIPVDGDQGSGVEE